MAKYGKKKNLRKKINPEKSNKMIYAVAVGLGIIFVVFIVFMLSGDHTPQDKETLIKHTLKYLEKTTGVSDVKINAPENTVTVIYEETEKMDHARVAQYAGLKLSNKLKDETVKVVLAKGNEESVEYTYLIKNGDVEKVIAGKNADK